jgi:plasmid stabilization system protein ParE
MGSIKDVFWTETAQQELESIYRRISANSKEQGQNVLAMVLDKTKSLSQAHSTGTVEPMLRNEKIPHFFVEVGFYKIIYSVEDLRVIIKMIYHTRQNPQ